jgi:hypothetical protein
MASNLFRAAPAAAPSSVASPCVSVCKIDAASGWCEGCKRTIDEIAHWARYSDAQKRAVLAALPARHSGTATG